MLTAVNGYIDGNKVIIEENNADWQGRNVVVTYMEIVQGMRNKQELEKLKRAFRTMNVNVVPITERII